MPGGIPKYVRCYDAGDVVADRYTVVYTGNWPFRPGLLSRHRRPCMYVSMSGSPAHPQGVCQHGEHHSPIDRPRHSHLGKRIAFQQLPEDCRAVVLNDYMELWELNRGDA